MDGGGGLSTIWGFLLVKRLKKLAHIITDLVMNPYNYLFGTAEKTVIVARIHRHLNDDA
jgi:hypothetical protein